MHNIKSTKTMCSVSKMSNDALATAWVQLKHSRNV